MKIIGLLGGMSWESTRTYYHHLNVAVREQLGGLHSARVLLNSVDFAPLEAMMTYGDWVGVESTLIKEAQRLETAGAEGLLLCTNTMHKIAPALESAVGIKFFHIADCLGESLQDKGVATIGLLGTRFTMIEDFYAARLRETFGIETLIPDEEDIAAIDRIIFEELCVGDVRDESRQQYLAIMDKLVSRGAESIALACTEIEMLITPEHTAIPLDDTTFLHADAAARWAMADDNQ
ncbi:MAG: aspartate/glutamate racemase family protein [Candidatus Puniceispirillales bacterium]